MISKKWFQSLVLFMSILLITVLSGCADGDEGSPSNDGDVDEDEDTTTITFMSRWPPFNDLLLNDVIPKFEEEHPDIHVEQLSYSSHGNYVKALQSAVNGDDLPDFFANHPKMPTYQLHDLGLLHELDDVIGERKDDFEEHAWTPASTLMDGNIYALPIFSNKKNTMLMHYNKSVLEEAGLTEDDLPESWDELVEVSKVIKDKTDAHATYLEMNYWTLEFLVNEMASDITPEVVSTLENTNINYKTGEFDYNTEGNVETIEFMKSLTDQDLNDPSDISRSEAQGPGVLASGDVAFLFSGAFAAIEMDQQGFDDYGTAPLPTKSGERKRARYSGSVVEGALHVAKDTEHYDEVKTFFEFLMDEGYSEMVKEGINYPPIPEVIEETDAPDSPSWKALTLQDDSYILQPDAIFNNDEAYKVKSEMASKGADQNVGDVARGYLKGQIEEGELEEVLQSMTDKQNKAFEEALEEVDGVDQSDWVFPNWKPGMPYEE